MKGAQRRRSMRFLGGQGSVKEVSMKEGSMKEGSVYQGSMKESSMKDGSEFDGSFDQVDFEPEQSCRELDPLNTYLEEPLTMYKWIQWKKCKTYKLNDLRETYPSIRPAISKCDPVQTLQNIDDALEANKCGRLFEKPERDDTLTVWNYSPNKETLAWYGIGPEADGYNKALSKSLKAASLQPKKPKKKPKLKQQKKKKAPSGAFVLNRECLKEKLDKMPNVRRQLNPINTLSFLHCPPPADPGRPFDDQGGFPEITLKMALDMQKKEKRPKHGLRRPTWYCPVQCGEAESKCTDYEWAKYKLDPRPYDEAFKREMEAEAAEKALKDPEPGNYEELYTSLATCFVQELKANDMCAAIAKCCKDPKDPPLLGCNEFTPDGAGGDGKFGDGHGSGSDDEDGKGKGKGKGKKGHGFGDEYDDLEGRDQDELGWGEDEDDGDGDGDGDGGGQGGGKGGGKGRGDRGRGKGHGKKGGGGAGGRGGGKKKKKLFESPSPMEEEEEELPPPPPPPPPPEPESEEEENGEEEEEDSKKSDDGKKKRKRRRRKKGVDDLYKNRGKVGGDKSGKDGKDGKGGKGKGGKGGDKDCPCEICCQVGKQEEDSPLIKEMRKRDQERQVREYLLQMRHRQYLECKDPDYRAPQHKCQAIECDARFCGNLRMQKHFGRVQAVQQLQRALKRRNRCGDKCLSKELDGLLSRLCNRLTRSGYCG